MSKLILVRGCPGSGKSTFAKTFNCFHVENDYFWIKDSKYEFNDNIKHLAIYWCFNTVKQALEAGMDVVVSNTFVKKIFIESYKQLANKYNAQFVVYCMKGNFENIHKTPENIKISMKNDFECYDDEIFVWPNEASKYDQSLKPYMMTKFKIGDHVIAKRFKNNSNIMNSQMEEAEAIITDIYQTDTYGYLECEIQFFDNSEKSIALTGDLKKVG